MRFALGFIACLVITPALASVVRVVDADTLEVDERRVRLDAIDAPEADQQCVLASGSSWDCGAAAKEALATWLAGKAVECETVGRDRRYGRDVARCSAAGENIEQWLIASGWAVVSRTHGRGMYGDEVEIARRAHVGIWSSCFAHPRDWRYTNKDRAELVGECPTDQIGAQEMKDKIFGVSLTIKVRVFQVWRAAAEHVYGIFHQQGCASYGKMRETALTFASADAAIAAGFRPAKNCNKGG